MNLKIRIGFITSCRSDFTKIRPYIRFFVKRQVPVSVFVTSMHVNSQLGVAREELTSYFPKGVRFCWDESFPQQQPISAISHLVTSVGHFLQEEKIQFVFVHGDRMEAFAAATAAASLLLPICQIEAGDVSGNIDESFRHAITKLSHRFLVDNKTAQKRVLRLGERPDSIFITGSSSLSLLPSSKEQQTLTKLYNLPTPYAIVLYHPETGLEEKEQYRRVADLVKELNRLPIHFLVLPPNNDPGYPEILRAYRLFDTKKALMVPSLSGETYLTLLNQAVCLIGNSSSAIKDAPVLGIPSIMVGSRQINRVKGIHAPHYKTTSSAQEAASWVLAYSKNKRPYKRTMCLADKFEKNLERIFTPEFFKPDLQKYFYESR